MAHWYTLEGERMALIVIKVRDADDGTVDVSLESEPPFSKDRESTDAQYLALQMLEAAAGAADALADALARSRAHTRRT